MSATTRPEAADGPSDSSLGASPAVASIFAGITAVLWAQVVIRYLAADRSLEFLNLLLPEKAVDVEAIWLASILVGLVVLLAAYSLFRKRRRVGPIKVWMAMLLVSAILRYL